MFQRLLSALNKAHNWIVNLWEVPEYHYEDGIIITAWRGVRRIPLFLMFLCWVLVMAFALPAEVAVAVLLIGLIGAFFYVGVMAQLSDGLEKDMDRMVLTINASTTHWSKILDHYIEENEQLRRRMNRFEAPSPRMMFDRRTPPPESSTPVRPYDGEEEFYDYD